MAQSGSARDDDELCLSQRRAGVDVRGWGWPAAVRVAVQCTRWPHIIRCCRLCAGWPQPPATVPTIARRWRE